MADNDWQSRIKTGRNDNCPCGSGKKYKKCHLREDEEAQSASLSKVNEEAAKKMKAEEHDHDHAGHDHPHEHGHKHDHVHGPKVGSPTNVQKQVSAPRKVGGGG